MPALLLISGSGSSICTGLLRYVGVYGPALCSTDEEVVVLLCKAVSFLKGWQKSSSGHGVLASLLSCAGMQGSNQAAQLRLPGKVFSMSHAGQRLVIATSSRHVLIYDIRK